MVSEIVKQMTWHTKQCADDGIIYHPTVDDAWKNFVRMNPSFVIKMHNIYLNSTFDGFNPFDSMSLICDILFSTLDVHKVAKYVNIIVYIRTYFSNQFCER